MSKRQFTYDNARELSDGPLKFAKKNSLNYQIVTHDRTNLINL